MKHQECFQWKKPDGCARGDACTYAHASVPKAKAGGKAAPAVAFICFGVPRAPLAAVTLASTLASATARVGGPVGKTLSFAAGDEVFYQP
eukprot:16434399-Heterocapsa_arctica.AAC.1